MIKSNHLRSGKYSKRKVRLPNVPFVAGNIWEAKPGHLVVFNYPNKDDSPGASHFGRVLGCVDAPRESAEIPEVKGWLAVLQLSDNGSHGYVRWINPEWVTECREVPTNFTKWFFAKELPSLNSIMVLDNLGSLSESYIEKYTDTCEACLQEHGLFAADKCTHDGRKLRNAG